MKAMPIKLKLGERIDALKYGDFSFAYVNEFPYLNMFLPNNGIYFLTHVIERCRKALSAVVTITNPHLLITATNLQLFN